MRKKPDFRRITAIMAVLAVAVLLTAGPCCLRNYVEFGHFGTSSNGGVNLWMGNNPYAHGWFMPMDALINETFGDVSGLNDFEKDALYSGAAKQYILAHPAETLVRDAGKLVWLYNSSTSGVYWSMLDPGAIADPGLHQFYLDMSWIMFKVSNYYYAAVFALACAGVLFFLFRPSGCNKAAAILLILYVLYFSAAYAATTAFDRYNFNVLPVFGIFGAYGIARVGEWAGPRLRKSSSIPIWRNLKGNDRL